MPMTKEEHDDLLKKIADSGGATDDMMELIKKLRDDYDEREGMYKEEERKQDEMGGEKWQERYNELKRKYIDRFFDNPDEARKEMTVEKEREEEDVKRDGEKVTYEELFKEREG